MAASLSQSKCPDSKNHRIEVDKTSIRNFRIGSMSNRCRSECICYMGGSVQITYFCLFIPSWASMVPGVVGLEYATVMKAR